MIKSLKPYPQYKDSGVPWLGKVPEHWEVKRGKAIFKVIDERSTTGTEELLTVSANYGVIPRKKANVTMFKAESYVGYKLCWPNDLVINSLWAWAYGLAISRYYGIVSSAYGVYRLKSKNNIPMFYHYLVRSDPFQWELQVRSKGIWLSRLQLTDESFLNAPFPVPPLPEQAAIVRFLDWAERRIRKAIRLRQRRIQLLQEYKQALIHQAVTGQIDVRTGQPYPEYKDSGVEWLGKVPKHWEVRRLKFIANIRTGGRDTVDRVENGKYPFFVRSQIVERIDTYSYDGEAVLTAGDGVGVGRVFHYINGKFDYHQRVYMFCNFRSVKGPFFYHYLRTTLNYEVEAWTAKSTVDSIRLPILENFPILVPSKSEQLEIIKIVEYISSKIDTAISADRRAIELLKELRTTLIAEVVTGKLDVREAAAQLPEAPESEAEDLEEIEEESAQPQEEETLLEEEVDD